MRKGITRLSVLCAGLALSAACTVHQSDTPSLTGPSEFATAIRVTATPDTINQDGFSQSAIVVSAFDASGRPASGIVLRLDMLVAGVLQDFGTLSARSLVTGSDGKANAVFTAPPAPPVGLGGSGTRVSIVAIPNGSDAQVSQQNGALAVIRLVPPGVILPPAGSPTASFTVSPTPVSLNVETNFDASASTPGTGATRITAYSWSFGDGDVSSKGPVATHTFSQPGTYNVTLTVTNDRGLSASQSQTVSVQAGQGPTAAFVFSPAQPVVSQTVQFNATGSTASPGHTISTYAWDFGDGTQRSGVTSSHAYAVAGTYNVTLTVTDDLGQTATTSQAVPVGTGSPVAKFTSAPTGAAHTMIFDGSSSTAFGNSTITTYEWAFGDGGVAGPSASSTATHPYAASGSFTVTLTVTDDQGRKGTISTVVSVP